MGIISNIRGHVIRSSIQGSMNSPTLFVDQLIKSDRNKRVPYALLKFAENSQRTIGQPTLNREHEQK